VQIVKVKDICCGKEGVLRDIEATDMVNIVKACSMGKSLKLALKPLMTRHLSYPLVISFFMSNEQLRV
jgi:hypothetical protein